MLNFFERQDQSRKATHRLIILFAMAVLAIILSLYFTLYAIWFVALERTPPSRSQHYYRTAAFNWWQPQLFYWVSGLTIVVIGIRSYLRISQLNGGGGIIAESLGGRLLYPDTRDPHEKRLLNVIEEMSIASGVPVPLVYVMDSEESINAFAAGYEPAAAVVAVTKGCLMRLNREELQAVIGHEFSHIISGDMRLNVRLIGLLAGILCIAWVGGGLIRITGDIESRWSAPFVFAGLALIAIGCTGVFFGRIIQAAVSRQREFLADASSVQFTRNPLGLAGALKKIGGFTEGSRVASPAAGETCHMFFASAIRSIFATHPPLQERIKLLDPGFQGKFPDQVDEVDPGEESPLQECLSAPVAGFSATGVAHTVGTMTPEHIDQGRRMIAGIPEKVKAALGNPLGACAAVCCLLLDKDAEKRGVQVRDLRAAAEQPLVSEFLRLAPLVTGIDISMRLPALDLAIPALRQLSPAQYEQLRKCIKLLIEADKKVTLFEFCLYTILTRRLGAAAERLRSAAVSGRDFGGQAAVLLSALAYAGQGKEAKAREAFDAGAACMKDISGPLQLLAPTAAGFSQVGKALACCAQAPPQIKQQLLEAFARCVLEDQKVTESEAELLRAVAYCLDLPLPVFLPVAN